MKRAANLKSVEWHETAQPASHWPTLSDADRQGELFGDDDRESGLHTRSLHPEMSSTQSDVPEEADVAQDEDPDIALEQVGPYRIIERIGSGAMGHVYRAEHTLLGRVVAIKMLRPELTHDEACVRRFLAEARAVNLIAHDHVIDVTDFACTPSGQPWFVMEMLEGSDLAMAASSEPLTLPRALEITRQVCEALAAAHTAGIVHRDVKPENIFLQQREGRDYVTLLDFGIARLPDPSSPDPLQEGLMGTPHYMAPEQISASPIDHRADLYAVGSMLFELVAGMGNTPFRAATLQKQLMDVLMQPPPRLSSRAEVPEVIRDRLDVLVDRCLAKQPSDRPASAREIADELAALAAELEPQVASPVLISETPTLLLRGSDAALVSAGEPAPIAEERAATGASEPPAASAVETRPSGSALVAPDALETRRRARRELRVRRAWTSRGATMLSAAAAALAMWVATSETSWAHAFSRVTTAWGSAASAEASPTVEPAPFEGEPAAFDPHAFFEQDSFASAHVDEATGGVGSNESILTATVAPAMPALVSRSGATEQRLERGEEIDRDERETAEERRARRAARAQARAERKAVEEASLVITPAVESEEIAPIEAAAAEPPEAPVPPTFDRDLVLNPFEQ